MVNFFVKLYAGVCMLLVMAVALMAIADKLFEINLIKIF